MASSPFSPTPSTSSLSSAAHSPAASVSAESSHSAGTNNSTPQGAKRLSCASCRKQKAKCVWVGDGVSCELCVRKGQSCPGSAPRAPNRKSAVAGLLPPSTALIPSSTQSSTQLVNVKWTAQHGSRAPAFSPYYNAAGRPRNLGPSSSEGSLNGFARANILKGDLINLYSSMWPLQLNGLPTDSFVELLQGKGDEASKVFVTACIAIGARSSSHSEIVQQIGPSLTLVDDDETGQFTPGGFSEWGVRRHGACVSLGQKAIEDARELVQTRPTFRGLKVMLAALMLSTSLDSDRKATRGITLVAINAYKRYLADPTVSAEERKLAIQSIGNALLVRDCYFSFSCGERLAFSHDEAMEIIAVRSDEPPVACFGVPDCVNYSGLLIFDETQMLSSFWRENHVIMYALASIWHGADDAFTPAKAAAIRSTNDYIDKLSAELEVSYEKLKLVPEEDVFVLHNWTGSWRPDKPKMHAIILVNELVGGLHHTNLLTYTRLQLELNAGRLPADDVSVAVLLVEARERARAALKHTASGIGAWMAASHKHSVLSNIGHALTTTPNWVELALGRCGENEGPLSKAAELSIAEIELLVRGLRLGSFSQSSIVVPLRELEAGLEQLRRDEIDQITKDVASGLSFNSFWLGGVLDGMPELAM